MKKQNVLLTTMLFLAMLAFGYQEAAAQCPGGTDCAACNPIVNNITRDFKIGNDYFYSSAIQVCGDACTVATGAGSFEWYIFGCSGATVLVNNSGFARINIPASCTGTLHVCMRFKAITTGGTVCWSPWYCEPI